MDMIKKVYEIQAPKRRVWDALVTPSLIKQYFFGTEAKSDWKEGSTITYTGSWNGVQYEDKGNILKMIPGELLTCNHWSGMTGKPDLPENYNVHSYELSSVDNHNTKLTLSQENKFDTDEKLSKAWNHWDVVIDGLKKLVEEEGEHLFDFRLEDGENVEVLPIYKRKNSTFLEDFKKLLGEALAEQYGEHMREMLESSKLDCIRLIKQQSKKQKTEN